MGLGARGTPGWEPGLRLVVRCRAPGLHWEIRHLWKGRGCRSRPAPAHSSHRHQGTRGWAAGGGQSPARAKTRCLCQNALPTPGTEARAGNRHPPCWGSRSQLWPGTEDVPAALVGALGELRQFSFSWFKKKKGKTGKTGSLQGQTLGSKSLGLLGLCSELPLVSCTPKGGTNPHPHQHPPPQPQPTNTRNLQPNTGSVKKGLWGILGEIQAPASNAGVGRGWRSRGGSLRPRLPSQ